MRQFMRKHVPWIVFTSVIMQIVQFSLYGMEFVTLQLRLMGPTTNLCLTLFAGIIMYYLAYSIVQMIREDRRIAAFHRKTGGSVELLMFLDPIGNVLGPLTCECGGYFGRKRNSAITNAVSCQECKRVIQITTEFSTLVDVGVKFCFR